MNHPSEIVHARPLMSGFRPTLVVVDPFRDRHGQRMIEVATGLCPGLAVRRLVAEQPHSVADAIRAASQHHAPCIVVAGLGTVAGQTSPMLALRAVLPLGVLGVFPAQHADGPSAKDLNAPAVLVATDETAGSEATVRVPLGPYFAGEESLKGLSWATAAVAGALAVCWSAGGRGLTAAELHALITDPARRGISWPTLAQGLYLQRTRPATPRPTLRRRVVLAARGVMRRVGVGERHQGIEAPRHRVGGNAMGAMGRDGSEATR